MIKIQGKLPRSLIVATSGGVDSMTAVDFLRRNHMVHMHFVDHGTETSKKALDFITEYALFNDIRYSISTITGKKPKHKSQEEFWRDERYKFFDMWKNQPVITCHHLDDCVETWVWSSLNGEGKIIPYRRGNVIRPFRVSEKKDFINWAERHNVPWIEDESNADTKHMRNYIRHEMMPHVLHINPGIKKVIKKKVENETI